MALEIAGQVVGNSLRVGICGYGLAGRFFHGALLRACGFDVVGVLTNNSKRIQEAVGDFPSARIASSIDELIDLNLDLMVVASGNMVHAAQALAAIEASIPVVVDKPMTLSLEQTKEVVDASKRADVPVSVFFNRRWDSDSLTIKKIMAEGMIGEVFRVDSRFERYRPSIAPTSWREKNSHVEGGGLLLDLQTHLISIAIDLFGPATLGYSSVRSIRNGADDDILLVLNHGSGVDSYLSASAIVGAPGPRLRVNGTKGTLMIDDLDPQEGLLRSGIHPVNGKWDVPTYSLATLHRGDEILDVQGQNGDYPQFYNLVKGALAGENEWPVSTDDALAVASLIDQARENSIR